MFKYVIKKYYKKIALISLFVVVFILFASFIYTPQYRSQTKLLIVQKHSFELDSYTAIRSSERVAGLLAQIIYTDSFMKQVLRIIPQNSDSNFFNSDERKVRKSWKKKIDVKVLPGSSMLEISAYDKNVDRAKEIVSAISYVLINRGANYHGGENVIIKQVDSPLGSRFPVRPNIPLNVSLALAFGLVLSTEFFYYCELKKIDKRQNIFTSDVNRIKEIEDLDLEAKVQETQFIKPGNT